MNDDWSNAVAKLLEVHISNGARSYYAGIPIQFLKDVQKFLRIQKTIPSGYRYIFRGPRRHGAVSTRLGDAHSFCIYPNSEQHKIKI